MGRKVAVADVPEVVGSPHPTPAAERCRGRRKRALGDAVGLDQFGVNHVTLPPGAWSTVRHWHSHEDEFVLVLSGALVLVTETAETPMGPGDAAGFKAGDPNGHRLENRSASEAVYLEVGARRPDLDFTHYVDDDLQVTPGPAGTPVFRRRDGRVLGDA